MPDSLPSFFVLDTVDSTNNYAMGQVHAGLAKHGDGWFSGNQTQGKGQRGKAWQTIEGENIALSVVATPKSIGLIQPFHLSALVAVTSYDLFSKYAGEETSIKWPNDIYWRDRKAAGILIENVFAGKDWKWAVIGMGININQTKFDGDLKNPVALKQITGKNFDTRALAEELHSLLVERLNSLNGNSFEKILSSYNKHLYKRNHLVKLKKDGAVFETLVEAVSAQGQLLTADATERAFDFGEVEWLSS